MPCDFDEAIEAAQELAGGDPEIYTNCRGYVGGISLDGGLDGWCWQAWCGEAIAYGATEEGAIENLRTKLDEEVASMPRNSDEAEAER